MSSEPNRTKLTRETWKGPWAGLPVAWTNDDTIDEDLYRQDVASCCTAGVPGVYTGGTTGEFYAMDFSEFCQVARATIEICHSHGKPAMIGCTSTYTRGVQKRAAFAAGCGANAIQVSLPYWLEMSSEQIVPFFQDVSAAAGGLPLSIYDITRSKRPLSVDEHRAVHEVLPNYLMVKSGAKTTGSTIEGCAALSKFVNVFVGESLWSELGPHGAIGCCSAMVYWNPRIVLACWNFLEKNDWRNLKECTQPLEKLHAFLLKHFGAKGFSDTSYDRLGGRAGGFLKTSLRCRAPYLAPTEQDVAELQRWYREHCPEMLEI